MKRKGDLQKIKAGASPDDEPVFALDDEEVLATLLFDQEAAGVYREPPQLSDGVSRDLNDYRLIKSGVQDWFQAIAAESAQKSPADLWNRIESVITAEAAQFQVRPSAGPIVSNSFLKKADRIFGRLFGFEASSGSGQSLSWRDLVAYGSSFGAVAVLVLLFFNSSFFGGSSGGPGGQIARPGSIGPNLAFQPPAQVIHSNSDDSTPDDFTGRAVVLTARNSDGPGLSDQLAVRDASVQSGGRNQPFGGLSSRDIQIDRLLQHSRLASVLRTDGADIEWIRSDRNFNLMPSANGKAPPAIWIARSTAPR